MRRFLHFLLIAFILQAASYIAFAGQDYITPEDAKKHIGEYRTVCGTVASTYYSYKSKGQPTFINLDRPYPNQIFTIVIWGSDRYKFNPPPEKLYKDKRVCVTGNISEYREKPQIAVKSPSQIQIK